MLPGICPKPSRNLIMLPSHYNKLLTKAHFYVTCVCCSFRSQRNPPVPQDSIVTSCQRQLVQIWLESLLPAALPTCLVVSLCFLTAHLFFGTLRSYFYHLKKGMGDQRREYDVEGPSWSWHSNGIWFQTDRSAWKSSMSNLPRVTFVCGPANFFRSNGPKWYQITNIQK